MEKIIQTLINSWTKGVDTYTHNGSTWLIFSDNKQWVIELTDSKTLWYNYNFFKQIFEFTSMDVVDNQQYITKWVEDNIINGSKNTPSHNLVEVLKNGVNHTTSYPFNKTRLIEDAIQNGVKETRLEMNITEGEVDDIIQDGVKTTYAYPDTSKVGINDTIQNGVKLTQFNDNENKSWVEGVIKNGIKETYNNLNNQIGKIEDVVKNGVRHTLNTEYMPTSMVEDIIQSGVKRTMPGSSNHFGLKVTIKNGVKRSLPESFVDSSTIIDIIQNGVKETKTPGNGDIESTIEWLKENNSTSYPKMIDDIIENGEKINGTYAGGQRQSEKCKSVVEYGTKNPTD